MSREAVAVETFGLEPARGVLPPLDALGIPQLVTTMRAVDAELTAGGVGGSLAAESLANVLAVHLIRHLVASARADSSLAKVAARAGFYDQSQFSHHFKRLVGVTPSQFRTPSRIA